MKLFFKPSVPKNCNFFMRTKLSLPGQPSNFFFQIGGNRPAATLGHRKKKYGPKLNFKEITLTSDLESRFKATANPILI